MRDFPNDAAHDEHDDDQPVGRVLSRREMLTLLGGSGAALLVGVSLPRIVSAQDATPTLPTCVIRPELTEGPYFVDEQLNRFDIRLTQEQSIKAGLPLYLIFNVSDVTGGQCANLQDAQVDVWHCDAEGVYSGVEDPGFDTTSETWLRGNRITDENGNAEFLTIIPGWYSGRAVHIHFKIRTIANEEQTYEFTSQLFFDPEFIETMYEDVSYSDRGLPDTPNSSDFIFRDSDGQLTLICEAMEEDTLEMLVESWQQERMDELPEGETLEDETISFEKAYIATFNIGLDLEDQSVGDRDRGGRGGRP